MFKNKKDANQNDLPDNTEISMETPDIFPEELPKAKKSRKKWVKPTIISSITAVALVGGGAAAYHFSSFVKNQVNLLIMKPEKYYVWVNKENARKFADQTAEKYQRSLDRYKKGSTSSVEIRFTPTDSSRDWMLEHIGSESYDEDIDRDVMTDVINNIDDISISLTNESKKSDGLVSMGLNLNDDSLISLDMALDLLDLRFFMRYPELKEQWLCLDYNKDLNYSIKTSDASDTLNKLLDLYREIIDDPAVLISPDELKDAINNYTNAWNDSIDDIDRKRSKELTIGGITTKYTVLDVDLDSQAGRELTVNFIKALSKDKAMRRLIVDKLELVSSSTYNTTFKQTIKSLKNHLNEDSDDDGGDGLYLRTYIDLAGSIRAFSLANDDVEFLYALGMHKGNYAIEISCCKDDEKPISFILNAKKSGKDAYTGYVEFFCGKELLSDMLDTDISEDLDVSIDFKDMKIGDIHDPRFTGSAELNIPGADPIKLKFKGDKNSQSISYNLKIDGEDMGDFSIIFKNEDGCKFKMPDPDDSYVVQSYEADEFDFLDYISPDDLYSFAEELLMKLGIDKDTAAEFAENAVRDAYTVDPGDL